VIAGSYARRSATGVTLTGQISQTMWQWAAVSRFTSEKQLLGQTAAVVIPCRSFASDSACEAAKAFIRARLSDQKPDQVPLDL
jgi:hypothetical protein